MYRHGVAYTAIECIIVKYSSEAKSSPDPMYAAADGRYSRSGDVIHPLLRSLGLGMRLLYINSIHLISLQQQRR